MNHVMSPEAAETLRNVHTNETRARIARAVLDVVSNEGLASLSFPLVAEEAGVSLRTVYRHFPNKEALLDAAHGAGSFETLQQWPIEERTVEAMRDFIPSLWAELIADRELINLQHATPAGRELRKVRMHKRFEECLAVVEATVPTLDGDQQCRVAAIIATMFSSSVLLDLVDNLGLPVEEAGAVAAYTIEAVTEKAKREAEGANR